MPAATIMEGYAPHACYVVAEKITRMGERQQGRVIDRRQ
jgi:hypothetical protein